MKLSIAVILSMLSFACKDTRPIRQIELSKFKCDKSAKELSDQPVAISGYLVPPVVIFCKSGKCSVNLQLTEEQLEPSVTIDLVPGSGPNTMDMPPENFRKTDFACRDAAGKGHRSNEQVVVTGIFDFTDAYETIPNGCRIRQVREIRPEGQFLAK